MKQLLVAAFICCTSIAQADPHPTIFDNCFLFGPSCDISERRGYMDYNGATEEEPVNTLFSYGGTFGKRWMINQQFRVQISGVLNYGTVIDDTLPPNTNLGITEPAVVEKRFLRGGLIADLQLPLPVEDLPVRMYLHAGAGMHITWYSESEMLLNNRAETIPNDPYLDSSQTMLSVSAHGGFGGEWHLSPQVGMSLSYTLRYGFPVHYTTFRDIYPFGAPYSERFITHEIDAVFLW